MCLWLHIIGRLTVIPEDRTEASVHLECSERAEDLSEAEDGGGERGALFG